MRNDTRLVFNQYTQQIAALNGVDSTAVHFSVEPSVQQRLETKMQESSAFLSRINIAPVTELVGEKLGLSISGPIAGRTDVTKGARQPRDLSGLDDQRYSCADTEYDTFLGYAKLDSWAKFPDFQTRVRDAILKRQALDRMTIGFNGTTVAKQTDRATNPMLQDVNVGWLQQYRTQAPDRVMASGKVAGKIQIGKDGDYANLDALVYDAVASLIDPWYRDASDLVVLIGRDLLHDKYFPLVNRDQPATEVLATDLILAQRRVGNQAAAGVPFFPSNAILVTSYDNLSIYWQEGGRRRYIKEEPEWKRVTNYESSNDAYVVEDYGHGCLIENIALVGAGGAA